ncbi:MAG: dienelactone hydrolase family protein [Actinomycetota bacterium]
MGTTEHTNRSGRRSWKRRTTAIAAVVGLSLAAASCSALPVTAFTRIPAPARTADVSGVEWYASPAANDREVRLALVRADGTGPHPVVLILPGSDGLHDDYIRLAREYAAQGFDAATGCWFAFPEASDTIRTDCANGPTFDGVSEGSVASVDALVDAALRATGAPADQLAIIGYSRGGGAALLRAARTGATNPIVDLSGMVTGQVGGWPSPYRTADVNVVASAAAIHAPTLALHGVADSIVVPTQTLLLATALQNAGTDVSVHWYPGSNHDLLNHSDTRADVIARSSTWIRQQLG